MDGKITVYDFVEEHNHTVHLRETTHMLSSEEKVLDVQAIKLI
jgi:hypothetical protein